MNRKLINMLYIILTILLATRVLHANTEFVENRAAWMKNNWGIRVLLPAGNIKQVYNYDPNRLVAQLSQLKTPKWVMLNITSGSYGGRFTSPNTSVMDKLNKDMFPARDLLHETIKLLKGNNYKILVYFASDGPLAKAIYNIAKTGNSEMQRIAKKYQKNTNSWIKYLDNNKLQNEDAVADLIKYYSDKFKTNIDGWWFDHGQWGNAEKYIKAARSGNKNAVIAWNRDHKYIRVSDTNGKSIRLWGLKKSHSEEDYTAGHTTPTRVLEPWSRYNERIIEQIESISSSTGNEANSIQTHFFTPIQRTWRNGIAGFSSEVINEWTERVIIADGAITWAVAMKPPEHNYSEIAAKQMQQLIILDSKLHKAGFIKETYR